MCDSLWDDWAYKKNFFLNYEKGYIYGRRDHSILKPPRQIERLGYPPVNSLKLTNSKTMKAFNIITILLAIVILWTTEAKTEDKIFLTIFFTIAMGFWLMVGINSIKEDYYEQD